MGTSGSYTRAFELLINIVNRAWLLELGRKFPTDQIQLDGFDINPSNFPAPGWLPSNLHLHVWNAFSEIPEDYVGVFDIVHIRAIYSAVIDNLVEPLLSNLLKMLKPRGFLQWDKNDGDSLACHVPSPDVKADAAKTIVKIQQVISRGQSKLLPDWLHNLPTTLQDRGCELVAHEEIQPLTELARAWTDNILLVWRSILPMLPETSVTLPSGMGLRESISQASFAELFKKAVDESSNGAALNMEAVVVVARKAL